MKLNTVILLTYSLAMIGCASSLKGKSMYPDSSITYRNGYILNNFILMDSYTTKITIS